MVTDGLVREAQKLVEEAASEEAQLELLEPLTAEEWLRRKRRWARMQGRWRCCARPASAGVGGRRGRNRRTDDFVKHLSQFGPDPAVLAQFLATSEEAMVERSYAIDPAKRRLSWGEARAMRTRAAEALMPFYHGKQPVRVDHTIRGVIVQEQIGQIDPYAGSIIDGEPMGVLGNDLAMGMTAAMHDVRTLNSPGPISDRFLLSRAFV
jgi:hypothetical protein